MPVTPTPPEPIQSTRQKVGEQAEHIVRETVRVASKPSALPLWWGVLGWLLVAILALTR